uniref:Uncharacterized protein n=2 Tax=Clytia hemisphaerica TaxID=252671 RepID=A0A7M5TSA6_9CNID
VYLYLIDNFMLWWKHRKVQKQRKYYAYLESISYVAGLLCQRDLVGSKLPISQSGKLISQLFAVAFLVVNTFIIATITANRIVDGKLVQEFKGLKDEKMQNPTSKFKFAATKDSSSENYFKRYEKLKPIYYFMRKYSVNSTEVGIKKLLNEELQAFMTEAPMVD